MKGKFLPRCIKIVRESSTVALPRRNLTDLFLIESHFPIPEIDSIPCSESYVYLWKHENMTLSKLPSSYNNPVGFQRSIFSSSLFSFFFFFFFSRTCSSRNVQSSDREYTDRCYDASQESHVNAKRTPGWLNTPRRCLAYNRPTDELHRITIHFPGK